MEEPKISQCKYLRTKMAHVANALNPEGWRTGESTTSAYWCLRTMLTAGPDNACADPGSCRPGRTCFDSKELIPS